MAEPVVGSDVLEETMGRLSKKAGVKATILLDRSSGAILKMDGQIASIRVASSNSNSTSTSSHANSQPSTSQNPMYVDSSAGAGGSSSATATDGDNALEDETKGARELAGLVWRYIKTSGDLVENIDPEDELKLLRLRTKKQELVIVPDPKYLLIVVHDTPPA